VVAVCITYHVGSRNEAAGHTGSTHILEHLLFKDSKHFNTQNGKAITGHLEWMGAQVNATTWLDRTNYYELVARDDLAEALAIEADRMRNSLFTDTDLASEMTVVRNEYEQGRNNPYQLIHERVMETMYTVHPYRIPTIGNKEDIEGSTATKLREFYDTYYWPNNATLTVFGDVSKTELEKLVIKYFAPLKRSAHDIPLMFTIEPPQVDQRHVEMSYPAGVSIAMSQYRIVEATHVDFPPLSLLAIVLAGGRASVLQRALVDSGIASDIQVELPGLHDAGWLGFTATIDDASKAEKVFTIIQREIDGIIKTGIDKQTLQRAQEYVLTMGAKSRDGVLGDAQAVSECIAAGDWTLDYAIEERVKKMTVKDIQNVASYLIPERNTTGVLKNTL
jgi:zinc protease